MSWFSRKKYVTHEEFNELMFTIRNSFANVKQDIANVKIKSQSSENYVKELQNIIVGIEELTFQLLKVIFGGDYLWEMELKKQFKNIYRMVEKKKKQENYLIHFRIISPNY